MTANRNTQAMFLDALSKLDVSDLNNSGLLSNFRSAFLALGSETPDNVQAVMQFNVIQNDNAVGIGVCDGQYLLEDIAWAMEDIGIPPTIAERFPDLTQRDWEAYGRAVTILLSLMTSKRTNV